MYRIGHGRHIPADIAHRAVYDFSGILFCAEQSGT